MQAPGRKLVQSIRPTDNARQWLFQNGIRLQIFINKNFHALCFNVIFVIWLSNSNGFSGLDKDAQGPLLLDYRELLLDLAGNSFETFLI